MSPSSDIVGPSPVTSNGTETTEIEDDLGDEHADDNPRHPSVRRNTNRPSLQLGRAELTDSLQLMMLRTNIPDHIRKSISDEAVSVIHAPHSFQNWVRSLEFTRRWVYSLLIGGLACRNPPTTNPSRTSPIQ